MKMQLHNRTTGRRK